MWRPRRTSAASRAGALTAFVISCELVVEAGVVSVRRRRDVLREELERQPAVAADDPDPAAVPHRAVDRGAPVGDDAELLRGQPEAAVPPALNVIGTVASRAARAASRVFACFADRPPTSIPPIRVPPPAGP